MNKINVFGKQLPVFLFALVLIGGIGSAAVLTYYGQIQTTINATQSVIIDGGDYQTLINDEISESAPGGETFCFKHILENRASVAADVEFETSGGGDGIETTYWTIPDSLKETSIELTSKDSSWVATSSMSGTLTYDTVNEVFNYALSGLSGLDTGKTYALIYYADEAPRFDKWENVNGLIIDTFSGSVSSDSGSIDIGTHLPIAGDWNINPDPDYCDNNNGYDDYDHCNGAKFWIVPTDDLVNNGVGVSGELNAWNPSSYLFETDLGFYFDCDITELPSDYPIDSYGESVTGTTISSGEEKAFFVCHGFDIAITPGTYTITTNVKPV